MFEKTGVFIGFLVIFTRTTRAYLDPGTGSMLFQLISALFLTGVFTIKIWIRAVKNIFIRKAKGTKVDDEQQNPK